MNVTWERYDENAWVARDADGEILFSVCRRSGRPGDGLDNASVWESDKPRDRWVVFHNNHFKGACGDLSVDLPKDEMKAVALAIWRMR